MPTSNTREAEFNQLVSISILLRALHRIHADWPLLLRRTAPFYPLFVVVTLTPALGGESLLLALFLFIFSCAVTTLLAVMVHRSVLLEDQDQSRFLLWRSEHSSFLFLFLVIFIAALASIFFGIIAFGIFAISIGITITNILDMFPLFAGVDLQPFILPIQIAFVVTSLLYVIVKSSLMFPATATGDEFARSWSDSWKRSDGYMVPLLIAFVLPGMFFIALRLAIFGGALSWPLANPLISGGISWIETIVTVVVVSSAYKLIKERALVED